MPPYPDKMDPLGIWLLKRVFIPVMLLFVLLMVFNVSSGKRKCLQMSTERGFLDAEYVPSYHYSGSYCIMKRKRNVDGTVDESAINKQPRRKQRGIC